MTSLLILAISLATCAATFLGGLLALGLKEKIHPVLGFSAGAVIGVAFFDLLPEALRLGEAHFHTGGVLAAAAVGFFLYVLADRMVMRHHGRGAALRRGWLGAGSFSAHSLLDGLGIGIAFQAGHAVGLVVASAVLAHDFADGLNTVSVVVKNGGSRPAALRWLAADAFAPVLGAALSLLVRLPPTLLALLLAGFCGFFLYVGAVDLLPESQRGGSKLWNSLSTLAGAGLLYAVSRLAV